MFFVYFLDVWGIPTDVRHEQVRSLRAVCVWLGVDDCSDTKQLHAPNQDYVK